MDHKQNPHIAVIAWAAEGRGSTGWPRKTWRRTVAGERQKMGFTTWNEAVATVSDRTVWNRQVNGPTLPEESQY